MPEYVSFISSLSSFYLQLPLYFSAATDSSTDALEDSLTESHLLVDEDVVVLYSDETSNRVRTPVKFPLSGSSCFTFRIRRHQIYYSNSAGYHQSVNNNRMYDFDDLYLGLNRVIRTARSQNVALSRQGAGLCCVNIQWSTDIGTS